MVMGSYTAPNHLIIYVRMKTFQNVFHPYRVQRTPHLDPPIGIEEGGWKGRPIKIMSSRMFLPKTNYFLHPPWSYPPATSQITSNIPNYFVNAQVK